ncbi:MAG TPA: hypothetical protein PLD46_04560 [Hyphomicrobium sp.]|nr:hypothetical protein [Hyphomicrobium sp.]
MPPRKPKSKKLPLAGDDRPAASGGFEEAPQLFEPAPLDDARFDDSVELMRSFNLIENAAARQKVIALARLLAAEQND